MSENSIEFEPAGEVAESGVLKVPAKRGRKPKALAGEISGDESGEPAEAKAAAKRGRKPKSEAVADAPEAVAPEPSAAPATPPTPTPAQPMTTSVSAPTPAPTPAIVQTPAIVPVINIVDNKETLPPRRAAASSSSSDAVQFDPSKILAQFAPSQNTSPTPPAADTPPSYRIQPPSPPPPQPPPPAAPPTELPRAIPRWSFDQTSQPKETQESAPKAAPEQDGDDDSYFSGDSFSFSPDDPPAAAQPPADTPPPAQSSSFAPSQFSEKGDAPKFPQQQPQRPQQPPQQQQQRPQQQPNNKPPFNNGQQAKIDRRFAPQQSHPAQRPPNAPNPGNGGNNNGTPKKDPQQGGGGKKEKFRDKAQSQKLQPQRQWGNVTLGESVDERALNLGATFDYATLNAPGTLDALAAEAAAKTGESFDFSAAYALTINELVAIAKTLEIKWHRTPPRRGMLSDILAAASAAGRPIRITGTLEILEDGNGLLVYLFDNYRIRELSAYVPKVLINKHGLLRGHEVDALALPAREGETSPIVVRVDKIMGTDPETVAAWTSFTELTPYYPTKRIFLETDSTAKWDNLSMRCVDLLCPIGFGQRGLIVAPPRTGKTILLQGIANSINKNSPEAHLIILLVDERPEEVTDFKRQVKNAEIVSSTFDESAESHVHAAEIVIERARRMVEAGQHVVILLDSITRLARAYNAMMPGTGKILSGGVESNALAKPKRFFGSARNIEGGGSLTILGTALVDTGSKMDEVIFEEFKGTGNMELDLDRDLSNKRIFPAISFERSGTRKEELLYHPDELQTVYSLRRAMKGVPSVEAMEQLIQRVKKTKTNIEFLITLSR